MSLTENGLLWPKVVALAGLQLSGSHRSTRIASDLASHTVASQTRPQREFEFPCPSFPLIFLKREGTHKKKNKDSFIPTESPNPWKEGTHAPKTRNSKKTKDRVRMARYQETCDFAHRRPTSQDFCDRLTTTVKAAIGLSNGVLADANFEAPKHYF